MTRHETPGGFLAVWPVRVLAVLLALSAAALGQDVADKAKEANSQLREAKNLMFNGKSQEAMDLLEQAEKLIGEIEAADPKNSKLTGLKSNASRLRRDLERKLKKDPPKKDPPPPDKGKREVKSDKLPSPVQRALQSFERSADTVARYTEDFKTAKVEWQKSLVSRMDSGLKNAESKLGQVKEEAGRRELGSHPSVIACGKRLDELRGQVEECKKVYAAAGEAAAVAAEGVSADVAALKELADRLRAEYFDKATGYVPHYNDLAEAEKLLAVIEAFETEALPEVQQALQEFAARYGTTRSEIGDKAYGAGYEGAFHPADGYRSISEALPLVSATRAPMAADLIRRAEQRLAGCTRASDFSFAEYLEVSREWFLLAAKFDADHEAVKKSLATLDQRIDQHKRDFEKKIDGVKWEGHASNSPENREELAKTGKQWFATSPDWGKSTERPYTVLDVKVTGPWSVQKTDLLGQIIMYGLPVRLAVQLPEDKQAGLARVFHLTLCTHEGVGVKQEPPFLFPTVGDSYFIRARVFDKKNQVKGTP